jgi:signal transduction histidine kinase
MVHRIVTEHGGSLDIANRPERGTVVVLTFPGAVLGEASRFAG